MSNLMTRALMLSLLLTFAYRRSGTNEPRAGRTTIPAAPSSTIRNMAGMLRYNRQVDLQSEGGPVRRSFDPRVFVPERANSKISRRYNIGARDIGTGSFGQVFVAEDRLAAGRMVAIKKVKTPDLNSKRAFQKEVGIMKNLDHPNICKIMETYEEGHVMYIVMEYCGGGEVFDRIVEEGMIAEGSTANIVRQVASALKYAHSKEIAHRDLKPENLCFCTEKASDSRVMVIDWGVGFYFGLSRMRSAVGSLTYTAPEVRTAAGGASYSSACDAWSLGVVTYVMLCGRPPFWGKNQLTKMQGEEYPMSSEVWQGISCDAKSLIRWLLKANPNNRLSIADVIDHPWLTTGMGHTNPDIAHQVLCNLRYFSNASELFSLCAASVARQLDHRRLHDVNRVFCEMDTNGDGVLELKEIRRGFERIFGKDCEELNDLEWMFHRLDLDGSGMIDYTEFCAAGIGMRMNMEEHALRVAFKAFDHEDAGRITKDQIKQVLSSADVKQVWPQDVCDQTAQDVMERFDSNGDGSLDFDEWVWLMRECAERHPEGFQPAVTFGKGQCCTECPFTAKFHLESMSLNNEADCLSSGAGYVTARTGGA